MGEVSRGHVPWRFYPRHSSWCIMKRRVLTVFDLTFEIEELPVRVFGLRPRGEALAQIPSGGAERQRSRKHTDTRRINLMKFERK